MLCRLRQRGLVRLFLLAAALALRVARRELARPRASAARAAAKKGMDVLASLSRRRRTLRAWLAKPRRAVPARGTETGRSRGTHPRATTELADSEASHGWRADERSECRTLKDVLQEQHAKEAHGCAGGRLHITQIGRARSAERRTALPALPHRPFRMGDSHPAALAATAAAPNLWRYVERPPIAPRAATTGMQRSKNFSGDAGMGEASFDRSAAVSNEPRASQAAPR
jgi:hypothetical protein